MVSPFVYPFIRHKVSYRMNSRLFASCLGISLIIFTWPVQIFVGSIGIPVYFIISLILIYISKFTKTYFIGFVGGVLFLSFLSLIQLMQGISFTSPTRTILSLVVIPFLFCCIHRWLTIILRYDIRSLFFFFRLFLMAQLMIQVTQLLMWFSGLYNTTYTNNFLNIPIVSGFFSEPSHVVVSLAPFIFMFVCYRSTAIKLLGKQSLIVLLGIFFMAHSATMIVAVVCALLIRIIWSIKSFVSVVRSVLFVLIFAGCLYFVVYHSPEISTRLTATWNVIWFADINSHINLSTLVLVKGAQMAWAALTNYPLGAGLLNMQILNDYSEVSSFSIIMENANAYDGASIAFKLIAEFGYGGLVVVVMAFIMFFRSNQYPEDRKILFGFVLFGMIVSFARGASYFDGITIIAIVAMFMQVKLFYARVRTREYRCLGDSANRFKAPQNVTVRPHAANNRIIPWNGREEEKSEGAN